MAEKIEKNRLILLDLDGTTLKNDYRTFNELNKKVLIYLKNQGHKICIVTGRNYLSALRYYKELELDTFMATYNGAYINNPAGKSKIDAFSPISNWVIKNILSEKIIQENLLNSLLDTEKREIICTNRGNVDVYWNEVWFNRNEFTYAEGTAGLLKTFGSDQEALQLILEFANDKEKLNKVITTLRQYRSAIFFDIVHKLKRDPQNPSSPTLIPDPEKMVVRIRSSIANKGKAAEWLSTHYNIPLSRTIAFGDDLNDIEIISKVAHGIVMANGINYLKTLGYAVTHLNNHEGGVADYLIKDKSFKIPENFLTTK